MIQKLEIPSFANIAIGYSPNRPGAAVNNWENFDRWAIMNVTAWRRASLLAASHRISDQDRTRVLAWMMVRAYAQMHNDLMAAAENGIFPPRVIAPNALSARLLAEETGTA